MDGSRGRVDFSNGLRFISDRAVTAIKGDAIFVGYEFPLGWTRFRLRPSQVRAPPERRESEAKAEDIASHCAANLSVASAETNYFWQYAAMNGRACHERR
jgi:hypothetical protein